MGEISANHVSDKGLIYLKYMRNTYNSIEKTIILIKKWAEKWNTYYKRPMVT